GIDLSHVPPHRPPRIRLPLSATPAITLAKMFGGKPAVIVQAGSNDSCQGDPIAELIRENPAWESAVHRALATCLSSVSGELPRITKLQLRKRCYLMGARDAADVLCFRRD